MVLNLGTDHAPRIGRMARGKKTGGASQGVNCPHENTAMHRRKGLRGKGRREGVGDGDTWTTGHGEFRDGMHNGRPWSACPPGPYGGEGKRLIQARECPLRAKLRATSSRAPSTGGDSAPYAKWELDAALGWPVMTKETLRRAHSVAHSPIQWAPST